MSTRVELKLVGEKILHQRANPCLLAYCPSMDLLAVGSTDQQISVYRLNGQRVYSATQKGRNLSADGISWKPNGQLIAIAWSDGVVRLVGAESSKNVHQIVTGTQGETEITCLAWVSNLTGNTAKESGLYEDESSWNQHLDDKLNEKGYPALLDLPRDLALIEIESSMPKLSTLPAGGTSEDIFSSRASLDGLFRTSDPYRNDAVDVMVVGTNDGRIHLSIYDSFIVGSFPSPLITSVIGKSGSQLILHASNKCYSTHALLMKSTSGIYFVPMDLRFISASSEYLSVLASKSTALQNLLRYIQQVQILMAAEWQATQDLPRKLLRNINETLKGKKGRGIVEAMYHSVATGHTFPAVREWLVNELAERGHKRWDKAVTGGLENLRKLVHEHMMPALERCGLILSRLNGVVKYQGPDDSIGFSSHQIDLVIETLGCLNLVSARILDYVKDELDLFAAFSGWLRHEIDRLASDSSSSPPDDLLEKEATIDHKKALLYIQGSITSNRLSIFFDGDSTEDLTQDWQNGSGAESLLDMLDRYLWRHAEDSSCTSSMPRLDLLCKRISQQATVVFEQIAEAERRNVLFGHATMVSNSCEEIPLAMRLCPQDSTHFRVYTAVIPEGKRDSVRIISVQMLIENEISTKVSTSEATVNLEGVNIEDLSFLDNRHLLALQVSKEHTSILSIPYSIEEKALSYNISPGPATGAITHTADEDLRLCETYYLPAVGTFVPEKFEVSERNSEDNKSNTTRICMLDKSRLHYKVFSVPKSAASDIVKDEDIPMA